MNEYRTEVCTKSAWHLLIHRIKLRGHLERFTILHSSYCLGLTIRKDDIDRELRATDHTLSDTSGRRVAAHPPHSRPHLGRPELLRAECRHGEPLIVMLRGLGGSLQTLVHLA